MSDTLRAMTRALAIAAAEWEALHPLEAAEYRRRQRVCTHRLHAVAEPTLLCEPDDEPPIATCPGCGAARPQQVLQLVVVPSEAD